jgi:hypothetical protein
VNGGDVKVTPNLYWRMSLAYDSLHIGFVDYLPRC